MKNFYKKSILFLLTTGSLQLAFGQQNEKITAHTYYQYKHLQDTLHKDNIYSEDMVLLLGKNSSAFISLSEGNQASAIQKQKEKILKEAAGSLPSIKISNTRRTSTTQLFHYFIEKKLMTKEFLIRNYLYEEPIATINWKLLRDTMSISGIACQKATTFFKGRNWFVWFAPSLPYQSGPWKLNGLPGLILQAQDEKKEIEFLFQGFEPSNNKAAASTESESTHITLPNTKILKGTKTEVDKLRQAMYADPKGFFMAYLKSTGGFVEDENAMMGFSMKNEINNPIEKP